MMVDIIHLNVGGVLFTTTRATLTIFEESMLGKMFNGSWDVIRDSEGRSFLDRDGSLFRYVLNFLRTGELLIPDDFSELQQLRSEADFYQIGPLIDAVENEIVRRACLKPSQDSGRISVRDYYLDVVEITTISGSDSGTCEKVMIVSGNLDVIKCLPIDAQIYRNILYLFSNPDGQKRANGPIYKSYGVFNKVNCVSSGDSTQIFLKTFRSQANSQSPSCALRINRSDLADTLLAKNCTLVSSSSEFRKTNKDTSELQCCDKWRIPEDSLNSLSNLPKL